jgi:hypothetical protein
MSKNDKKILILLIFTLLISLYSYYSFSTYKPKILRKIEEVRGLKTAHDSEVPFPENSNKISFTRTNENTITTFQTQKSPVEVVSFYKNVLSSKYWIIDFEQDYENFSIINFRKQDKDVNIIATKQDDLTMVSVKITQK